MICETCKWKSILGEKLFCKFHIDYIDENKKDCKDFVTTNSKETGLLCIDVDLINELRHAGKRREATKLIEIFRKDVEKNKTQLKKELHNEANSIYRFKNKENVDRINKKSYDKMMADPVKKDKSYKRVREYNTKPENKAKEKVRARKRYLKYKQDPAWVEEIRRKNREYKRRQTNENRKT